MTDDADVRNSNPEELSHLVSHVERKLAGCMDDVPAVLPAGDRTLRLDIGLILALRPIFAFDHKVCLRDDPLKGLQVGIGRYLAGDVAGPWVLQRALVFHPVRVHQACTGRESRLYIPDWG